MFDNAKIAAAMAADALKPSAVKELSGNIEHAYLRGNPTVTAIIESRGRQASAVFSAGGDGKSVTKPVGSNGIGSAVPRGVLAPREPLRKKQIKPSVDVSPPPPTTVGSLFR